MLVRPSSTGVRTYQHLLVLILDTGTLVDQVDVVGEQGVTRVLRNDTEGDENSQPPAVALGLEEIDVARVGVGVSLHADGVSHFGILKLNGDIVLVSIGMVEGKRVQGLFVALL